MARIFVSYSREDSVWVRGEDSFITWLGKQLKDLPSVEIWSDHALDHHPGADYERFIGDKIEASDFALLMLSHDFVASEFIRRVELPKIRERVEAGAMQLIPILVAHIDWNWNEESKWLRNRHIIPGKPTPLMDYMKDEAAWRRVRTEIASAVRDRIRSSGGPAMPPRLPSTSSQAWVTRPLPSHAPASVALVDQSATETLPPGRVIDLPQAPSRPADGPRENGRGDLTPTPWPPPSPPPPPHAPLVPGPTIVPHPPEHARPHGSKALHIFERSLFESVSRLLIIGLALAVATIAIIRFADAPQHGVTPWFLALLFICIVLVVFLSYVFSRIRYIGFNSRDPDRLVRLAARELRQSKESLYYYGAVGFINTRNNMEWQDELTRKLSDPDFKMVRMVDLQTLPELERAYAARRDLFDGAVRQYRSWIGVHLDRMVDTDVSVLRANEIYSFVGAPVWQFGIHVIVFDERHVLMVYRKDDKARGFLVRDHRAFARDIVAMMRGLVSELGLRPLRHEDLKAIHDDLTHYLATRGHTGDGHELETHYTPVFTPHG